jgi:choline dehydrogenase-like flavoprotein
LKKMKTPKFDVAIVGAGASGCVAAEQLCSLGYKVALLDAGSADGAPKKSTQSWSDRKHTHYAIQNKSEAFSPDNEAFFVRDSENPYEFPRRNPFYWIRSRSLGGRMNLWTGECYRMSNLDFKAGSRDGKGADWPLDHDQLSSDYEKAEKVLKIRGHRDQIPTIPDGNLIEAPPLSANEKFVQSKLQEKGIPVILDRLAVGHGAGDGETKPPNLNSLIHNAEKTANLTYIPNFVVRSLRRGKNGLIESVEGVSSVTKLAASVHAKVFILSASTLETTRILMNSQFKKIRGEKVLGRYLNDHIGGPRSLLIQGYFPHWESDGDFVQRKLYVPRYQNLGLAKTWPFHRGFSTRICLKRLNPFFMGFSLTSFGESLSYEDNRVELNDQKRDSWGVPTLEIKFKMRTNESRMFDYMKWELTKIGQSLTEIKGAKITDTIFSKHTPGLCNHEVGTCRMGEDPNRSFLNSFCRSHDIENLYVTDGSSFPSLGTANPTLTLMALTYRACRDISARA